MEDNEDHVKIPTILHIASEIRWLIYICVYSTSKAYIRRTAPDGIPEYVYTAARTHHTFTKIWPHPLLQVCKQIRKESADLFHQSITFSILRTAFVGYGPFSPKLTCLTSRVCTLEVKASDFIALSMRFPSLAVTHKPETAPEFVEIVGFPSLCTLKIRWSMCPEDEDTDSFAYDVGLLRCLVFFRKTFIIQIRFSQYILWDDEGIIFRGSFDTNSGLKVGYVHALVEPRIKLWEQRLRFALCLDDKANLFNEMDVIQASRASERGANMYRERLSIDKLSADDYDSARAAIAGERQVDFKRSWLKHFSN